LKRALNGDLEAVRKAVDAALASLEANRVRIDDLNVYPVPDGDTGTNLTLTVRSIDEALGKDGPDDRPGLAPLSQQVEAIDAVIGIDQRLGRDAAQPRRDMRHAGADREKFCRDRDAELSGFGIAGDDRPGHLGPSNVMSAYSYRPAA